MGAAVFGQASSLPKVNNRTSRFQKHKLATGDSLYQKIIGQKLDHAIEISSRFIIIGTESNLLHSQQKGWQLSPATRSSIGDSKRSYDLTQRRLQAIICFLVCTSWKCDHVTLTAFEKSQIV